MLLLIVWEVPNEVTLAAQPAAPFPNPEPDEDERGEQPATDRAVRTIAKLSIETLRLLVLKPTFMP